MGHGDHWGAIEPDVEKLLPTIIPTVIVKGEALAKVGFSLRMEGQPERASVACAIQHPRNRPLRYLALLADNQRFGKNEGFYLHSGYPYLAVGKEVEVRVDEVTPWGETVEEAVEGHIRASFQGASITFFDPLFYLHKMAWVPGAMVRVQLAGLAYSLSKADMKEFVVTEGPLVEQERERVLKENPAADPKSVTSVTVSMEGSACLIGSETVPDDASFRCPVLSVRPFAIGKRRFRQIEVVFMRPGDFELQGIIYASEHVLKGYEPAAGDDIEGSMWMQGTLKEKP